MSSLGFAIIGAGNIARKHAQALRDASNARLVAIHSRSAPRGRALADEYGVEYVDGLDHVLERPDVDAVAIATPSGTHLEVVEAVARAGKHVLCEKPLEVTPERVDRLIAACDRAGVTIACVFQARLNRHVQKIREALDAGRFGRLLLANVQLKWYRSQEYYDQSDWRGTWALDGGGVLMNQSIHMIDLMLYLVGPVSFCAAVQGIKTHVIEAEDNVAALLRFENGAVGTIEASTSCSPGFPRRLEISGEHGSIVLEDDRLTRWAFDDHNDGDDRILHEGRSGDGMTSGASDPTATSHEGHRRLIEDMVEAVATGREPRIPGREGRRAVEVIHNIYQALRANQP